MKTKALVEHNRHAKGVQGKGRQANQAQQSPHNSVAGRTRFTLKLQAIRSGHKLLEAILQVIRDLVETVPVDTATVILAKTTLVTFGHAVHAALLHLPRSRVLGNDGAIQQETLLLRFATIVLLGSLALVGLRVRLGLLGPSSGRL